MYADISKHNSTQFPTSSEFDKFSPIRCDWKCYKSHNPKRQHLTRGRAQEAVNVSAGQRMHAKGPINNQVRGSIREIFLCEWSH